MNVIGTITSMEWFGIVALAISLACFVFACYHGGNKPIEDTNTGEFDV